MADEPRKKPPKKKAGQGTGPRTIDGQAMDVRTGSAFCGWSEKTSRAMVARGTMPHRRLGGRIIFLRFELDEWLQSLDGCGLSEAQQNLQQRRLAHE